MGYKNKLLRRDRSMCVCVRGGGGGGGVVGRRSTKYETGAVLFNMFHMLYISRDCSLLKIGFDKKKKKVFRYMYIVLKSISGGLPVQILKDASFNPADTRRQNNVVLTSWRRIDVVIRLCACWVILVMPLWIRRFQFCSIYLTFLIR